MSWYYIKKTKTIGPITIDDIATLIKNHQILSKDLVSFELNNWMFAYEHVDLYELFKNIKFNKIDEREWVVMTINKNGGRKQLGPFTEAEVKAKVMSGQIKYTDLAWCNEMLQWYPITMIELFNEDENYEYYKSPKEIQKARDAKPYLIYVPNLPKIDLPPEEADGESLV